jgi:hypothetical protein
MDMARETLDDSDDEDIHERFVIGWAEEKSRQPPSTLKPPRGAQVPRVVPNLLFRE